MTITRRIMSRLHARVLVALLVGACTDAAAPVAPPTVPPPPPSGSVPRIFLADTGGRVTGVLVAGERPAWSPDGTRLAFERDGKVRLVKLDGTGEVAVADGGTPAWSPDGARLALANAEGIVIVGSDGSNPRLLVRHHFRTGVLSDWDVKVAKPSWSADGSAIAFEHPGYGDVPAQIFVVPVAGAQPERFTATIDGYRQAESDPAWSPDGSRIAFWSAGYGLAVARVDDGVPVMLYHELPTAGYGANPRWSPDGTTLAFTMRRGPSSFSVAVVRATDGGERSIRELIADARDAVWSPDGTRLAFVRTRRD